MRFIIAKHCTSFYTLRAMVLIQLAAITLVGCKKENPINEDAGMLDTSSDLITISGSVDASIILTDGDEAKDQAEAEASEPTSGITTEGEEQIAHGIGSAPVGYDISLARDTAANRAHKNLLKLLKDKGIEAQPQGTLKGATIRRFWKHGRSIFAEAVVSLGNVPQKMNQPSSGPSNPAEGNLIEKKDSTKGGMEP
jgi:hypothetical protein